VRWGGHGCVGQTEFVKPSCKDAERVCSYYTKRLVQEGCTWASTPFSAMVVASSVSPGGSPILPLGLDRWEGEGLGDAALRACCNGLEMSFWVSNLMLFWLLWGC
jgi:hypothetical protein